MVSIVIFFLFRYLDARFPWDSENSSGSSAINILLSSPFNVVRDGQSSPSPLPNTSQSAKRPKRVKKNKKKSAFKRLRIVRTRLVNSSEGGSRRKWRRIITSSDESESGVNPLLCSPEEASVVAIEGAAASLPHSCEERDSDEDVIITHQSCEDVIITHQSCSVQTDRKEFNSQGTQTETPLPSSPSPSLPLPPPPSPPLFTQDSGEGSVFLLPFCEDCQRDELLHPCILNPEGYIGMKKKIVANLGAIPRSLSATVIYATVVLGAPSTPMIRNGTLVTNKTFYTFLCF